MKIRKKILSALLLCGFCTLTVLGCGSDKDGSGNAATQEDNSPAVSESETHDSSSLENLGEFSMKDIAGSEYTQEMFADYDLTMVNVFTTWCTPCINEIPDLEKLKNNMADQGVNVVGIVLDAIDASGGANEETVEKAKLLAEQTGVTYPFLIPDETLLNGRLAGINAVRRHFL